VDLLKSFLAEISTNPLGQPAAACLDNGQFPTLRFAPIDRAAAARPDLCPCYLKVVYFSVWLLSRFLLRCSDPIPSGVRSGREMKQPITSVSVHRGKAEACCIRKGLAGMADERLLDRKESKALTQI
jgi:hypothetical protein